MVHGTDNLTPYSGRTGSLRGPQHAGVRPPEQRRVPIFLIGVPAIKCPARCVGGSTTTNDPATDGTLTALNAWNELAS
jgi:hypothetical protein